MNLLTPTEAEREMICAIVGAGPGDHQAQRLGRHPAVAAALGSLVHALRTVSVPAHAELDAAAETAPLLPVYLLIDTSGSMKGEPIEAVTVGLDALVAALRRTPGLDQRVRLSLITYNREAHLLLRQAPLEGLVLPEIRVPASGPTHLGEALERLCREMDRAANDGLDATNSVVFIMTDGTPSDTWLFDEMVGKVKSRRPRKIVACAVGPKARLEPLSALTAEVVRMDGMDSASFESLFQWVTLSIVEGSDGDPLPKPPSEIVVMT